MRLKSLNFHPQLTLIKKGVTSGASRNIIHFKNVFPVKLKCKQLLTKVPYKAGRNNTGKVVIRTRKTKLQNPVTPTVNYTFRSLNLLLVAGFILVPKTNKLVSLTVLSSGSITYTPTPTTHELFHLARFQSVLPQK